MQRGFNQGNAGVAAIPQKQGQPHFPPGVLSYLRPNYFIVCFLNINTAIYVTLVVFVQNRKKFGLLQKLVKKLKI